MGRLFGTDGVRGLANRDLTPEVALSLSVAAAHVLAEQNPSNRPLAVVGRDPRASGEMLEAAVIAGLTSAGADVMRLGVLPTPALAYLTAETSADLGIMLSASHNPMPDNGIKLFARGGHKLPDRVEDAIEARMTEEWPRPIGTAIGRIRSAANSHDRYIAHLLATLPNDLAGLRVVVDCAHGAASLLAPEIYRQAGAEVIAIGAEPNGENINDNVGSTHIDGLVGAVAAHQADLGIAHDGDADRCFAVTADGLVVDGDGILAICALAMARTGKLRENTVVTTVMSNLGFHHAMRDHGIKVLTVPVGDRYVLEKLHEFGLSLGGEQSGHIVFPDHATTGDGILTALQLMHQLTTTGKSLAELASVVHRFPQVLINVPVTDRNKAMAAAEVDAAVAGIERELGEDGRVLLRPSGTEQLIRVMVEAPTEDQARTMANQLSEAVLAASK